MLRTGTTGYIGGDAFYVLYNKHPDWSHTALVRSEEKAKKLKDKFPNVSVVFGTLDSLDLLEDPRKRISSIVCSMPARIR